MTLPYLTQTEPKQTKAQLKKVLKQKLGKYANGLTPVHKYTLLKDAKSFAVAHNLDLPDWFQDKLTKAAKHSLTGYVNYLQNPSQFE